MAKVSPESSEAKVSPESHEVPDDQDLEANEHSRTISDDCDEHASFVIARQRRKYVEIHNLHARVGCDIRKTPTIRHIREAAGEGRLMW